MLDYLIERDREEALRIARRLLAFPDGTTRAVDAYRMVWRWYDHPLAYEFAADAPEILDYTLRTMDAQDCEEGEALARVVEYLVTGTEAHGGDVTDDNLALGVARAQKAKWAARKAGG